MALINSLRDACDEIMEAFDRSMQLREGIYGRKVGSFLDAIVAYKSRLWLARLVSSFEKGQQPMVVFGGEPLDDLTMSLLPTRMLQAAAGPQLRGGESGAGRLIAEYLRVQKGPASPLMEFLSLNLGGYYSEEINSQQLAKCTSVWLDEIGEPEKLFERGSKLEDPQDGPLIPIGYSGPNGPLVAKSGRVLWAMTNGAVYSRAQRSWRRLQLSVAEEGSIASSISSLIAGLPVPGLSRSVAESPYSTLVLRALGALSAGILGGDWNPVIVQIDTVLLTFFCSDKIARATREAAREASNGQGQPTLQDLRAVRAANAPSMDKLKRTFHFRSRICQKFEDMEYATWEECTAPALWDMTSPKDFVGDLVQTLKDSAELSVYETDSAQYNPVLAFVRRHADEKLLPNQYNDLIKKARGHTFCNTSMGTVVLAPEVQPGILVPAEGSAVMESWGVFHEHSTAETILGLPATLRCLGLNASAQFMGALEELLKDDVANITNVFDDGEMLALGNSGVKDRKFSIRQLAADSRAFAGSALAPSVLRYAVSTLVRMGFNPTDDTAELSCYADVVATAYRPQASDGTLEFDSGTSLRGLTVYFDDREKMWLKPCTTFLRKTGRTAFAALVTGKVATEGGFPIGVAAGIGQTIDDWAEKNGREQPTWEELQLLSIGLLHLKVFERSMGGDAELVFGDANCGRKKKRRLCQSDDGECPVPSFCTS